MLFYIVSMQWHNIINEIIHFLLNNVIVIIPYKIFEFLQLNLLILYNSNF